jgi:hypothetical protein
MDLLSVCHAQKSLDPAAGADKVRAIRKEVHRMRLRRNELLRSQERLQARLQRGIAKREAISVKARLAD